MSGLPASGVESLSKPMRRLAPAATTMAAKSGDVLFKREVSALRHSRSFHLPGRRFGCGDFHDSTHLSLRGCPCFGNGVLSQCHDFIR